ncbi:MAG: hypothetical protein K2Z81_27305, partial [Cyanobacteria bacterium]|nr:hypothetical protein [Cyanobacteriota bacterium]
PSSLTGAVKYSSTVSVPRQYPLICSEHLQAGNTVDPVGPVRYQIAVVALNAKGDPIGFLSDPVAINISPNP